MGSQPVIRHSSPVIRDLWVTNRYSPLMTRDLRIANSLITSGGSGMASPPVVTRDLESRILIGWHKIRIYNPGLECETRHVSHVFHVRSHDWWQLMLVIWNNLLNSCSAGDFRCPYAMWRHLNVMMSHDGCCADADLLFLLFHARCHPRPSNRLCGLAGWVVFGVCATHKIHFHFR